MAKFKKTISLLMVGVMGLMGAACASVPDGSDSTGTTGSGFSSDSSQELEILKSDFHLTPEQQLSRIKAEYLLKNQGYADDDKVVAILSLEDDAIIDHYLASDSKATLADYVASSEGREIGKQIGISQTVLVRDLTAQKLIDKVDYTYSTVTNAVAVTTSYKNFLALEEYEGLKSVVLSDTFDRPQEADNTDASAIVNAVDVYETGIFNSGVVESRGITGKGTSVAVLDSGFDMSHPVFQRTPEGELMYSETKIGEFLAKTDGNGPALNAKKTTPSLKTSDVYYSAKIPFSYDYADKDPDVFPYDSEHGTHVAGIIGGYDESGYTDKDGNEVVDENGSRIAFRGVAKDTQLVLMKVFPNLSEGAETEDILAALEDAVVLGVDCINMSLGMSCGFAREADGDPINDVYDKITESGVSLITAASNSFSSGYGGEQGNTNFVTNPDSGTVGSPSTYEPALSVASISGTKSNYIVANGTQVVFFDESNSIAGLPNDFFAELYRDINDKGARYNFDASHYADRYDNVKVAEDGSVTLQYVTVPGDGLRVNYSTLTGENSVKGKIALVRRGNNTFEDKALQAKNAGAIGCIIYNNVEGEILMSMGKSDHIPTVSISRASGVLLAEKRTGTIVISNKQEAGPFMSDFSSWGPLPDLSLKPEITAHGGNITSSVPGGKFDELSGTSMACPNLCGMMVLVRQFLKDKYPTYEWKEISNLANQMLMSTAGIILNEEGIPYSPRKQGAGLANLSALVNAEGYLTVEGIDRTKLELKDDPERKGVYEMEFNVVNITSSEQTYKLSLFGMTESVSASDSEHVAETGKQLDGKYTVEVKEGGTYTGGTLTVPSEGTAKVKVVYTLTQGDKDMIDDLFPYGMYVEGFVMLEATGDTKVDLNIPFLAFYGDWTQAPIFDKTFYEVESEAHDLSIDEEDKLKADYYATTPYGSYYYNYIIPLGSYLYDIDPMQYDAIPATEDHAAVSDLLGTVDGIAAVAAGVFRNCKTMHYTVTDKATGEVVFAQDFDNMRKAYSQGGGPIPCYEQIHFNSLRYGLVNNRQYTFTMVGDLDYERDGKPCTGADTNVRNTFSFDFWMDNEAPVIKSSKFETEYDKTLKKNRYYLTLTVYDNRNAMSVAPFVFSSSNLTEGIDPAYLYQDPIPVYGDAGADNSVRFEITDILEDVSFDELITNGLGIILDDYALNQNVYIITFPGTEGDFRFTANGQPDGTTMRNLSRPLKVGEIIDLTNYLSTGDTSVDEGKDYLRFLEWKSSNEHIATVKEGQVLGLRPGTTTISATEKMLGRSASIIVIVSGTATTAVVEEQDTETTSKIVPLSQNNVGNVENENLKSLRFAYFDTVHAHARAGQTEGLDTSNIGTTGSRTFLSSLPGGISCYPGESFRLYYDLDPWYVADKYEGKLKYTSTNNEVATVDENGIVVALKKGTTTIQLRVEGSNIMARVRVTVNSEFVIDDARTLVAYKGRGGDVVIPDDEGILYVGSFAFSLYTTDYDYGEELPEDDYDANKIPSYNDTVRSVVVPEGVQEIQKYAFYNCTGLEEVTLPSTIKFVREYAFYHDAKLKSINLEDVEVVGAYAFSGCSVLGMDIDGTAVEGAGGKTLNLNEVYAMGDNAFENCIALEYVDLSALRNTGKETFKGCTALKKVKFDAEGRTKLSANMFQGSGLQSLELYEHRDLPVAIFAECASLESVVFHGELISIGEKAFAACEKLKSVTLPDSAFLVGQDAFRDCAVLSEIHFAANTRMNASAANVFKGCAALTTFTVDGGNTVYKAENDGKYLVSADGTALLLAVPTIDGAITIDNYTTIGSGAFSGTAITSVVITSALSRIDDYAFSDCGELLSVTLPENSSPVAIGVRAFNNCKKLATVENLDQVKHVEDYAFTQTALTSITVPADAEYGMGAFLLSSLQTVTIEGNASFALGVFQDCTSLTTVNMPKSGKVTFGMHCFLRDTSLETIDLSSLETVEAETFFGCSKLKVANLENATTIGEGAFADCSSLATVTMPKVVSIGESAFARVSENGGGASFKNITLPETLESLGDSAFLGCEQLESVKIPSKIKAIPQFSFAFCLKLGTVELPAGLDTIEGYAFMGCAGLDTINLGNVKHIGEAAFISSYVYGMLAGGSSSGTAQIHALETVDLSSAEDIGIGAFAGGLVTGDISAPNLVSIGELAFYKVNRSSYGDLGIFPTILTFDAPKLETIGASAFEGNISMKTFKVYPSVKLIDFMAFYDCLGLTSFTDQNGSRDAVVNDYVTVIDGNLYTHNGNGDLVFSSYPAGRTDGVLEIAEGTFRIEDYAGNENKSVVSLVLPDSLEYIGDHAFYGCNALRTVEFRSSTAPKLESLDTNVGAQSFQLSETDPGYDLLHNEFDMFGLEKYYFNFIDLVGKRQPISMVLPANETLSGYDSIVFEAYFGKVENAQRSGYVAMEQTLKDFLRLAKEVSALDNVVMANEKLISDAVTALNAVKQDATAYGVTQEEWNGLVSAVGKAQSDLARLKVQNAKRAVRLVQELLDALPTEYDGTDACKQQLDAATAAIESLNLDDRAILIRDRYNALLESYEESLNPENPSGGDEKPSENKKKGCGSVLGAGAALVSVLAAAAVAFGIKKKKD